MRPGLLLVVGGCGLCLSFAASGGAAGRAGQTEVSPFLGGYVFDSDAGFETHAPVFGGRLGYYLSDRLEPELSIEGLGTEGDESGARANFFQGHLDLVYHFDPEKLGLPRSLVPFLAGGAGAARYQGGDRGGTDWDFLANYGAGLEYELTERLGLRLDARQPVTFGPARWNFLYTLGLTYRFGGGAPVAAAEETEAPPAPLAGAGPPAGTPPAAAPSAPAPVPRGSEPPPGTAAVEPAPEAPAPGGPGGPALELRRVHFAFDDASLSPEAQTVAQSNASALRREAGARIRVEGHCDERGTTEYNLALGEKRARAALQALVDLGVAPERLEAVSYGRERPLDPGHNEAAWAQNRRAEFVELGGEVSRSEPGEGR